MRRIPFVVLAVVLLLIATAVAAQPVAEHLGPQVVRFHADASARDAAPPSLSVTEELPTPSPLTDGWRVRPGFGRVQGRPTAFVAIAEGTSLYGTGEVAGPLLRNGTRTVAWNYDAYGYGDRDLSLYQSHPWVLAVRADGTAFGVLADTPERCLIDLRTGIRFEASGPAFPVYVLEGDSPQDVLRTLATLVGTMPLPPRWALGYHQCRYSYTPDSRVLEIADGFRDRDIPCDVIWLDIDYMDGFRCFTFDPQAFPDPRGLLSEVKGLGYHTVAIIDPGIKEEPGYHVYDSGQAIDAWVRTRDRITPYRGNVWPGRCVFPDYTRADVRQWWGDLYPQFLALGIDGIWNDMNEPAVFNTPPKTMPAANWHQADEELGGPGTHARYHNVYGMLMARATWEGVQRARPQQRPFVLSRANHLGGQKWAAAWTGDNTANWPHVASSITTVLNMGLAGQPLSGPDIGGFIGAGSGPQFARWMGIGALLPFARGHTGKGNVDKEPWSFGDEVEATSRRALQRRYRLLPFLYTLQREAAETGLPPMRPLFFADPADPALRAVGDQFLLGEDVLVVAAVTADPRTTPPVLPEGSWRRFHLVEGGADDPDLPDLYLRGGAVLPVGPIIAHTGQWDLSELDLLVSLDENGQATGLLYEDAGDGYGYRTGEYRLTRYLAAREGDNVTLRAEIVAGDWPAPERALNVRVLTGR